MLQGKFILLFLLNDLFPPTMKISNGNKNILENLHKNILEKYNSYATDIINFRISFYLHSFIESYNDQMKIQRMEMNL